MGRKKEETIQRNCRIPVSIDNFVEARAKRRHGQDYTAAVIELLSIAHERIIEEEKRLMPRVQSLEKKNRKYGGGADAAVDKA